MFKKSLHYNSHFHAACNGIANCYLELGVIEQAVKHFEKALRLKPNSATSFFGLGRALFILKRFQEAESFIIKCINSHINQFHVYNTLGNIYLEVKNYDKAI